MIEFRNRKWKFLPAVIFVVSCLFLIMLLFTVKPAVFFSGDGGLKYLVAQQVNKGEGAVALKLKGKGWVIAIWQKGFYPFKPPFVYGQQGEKIVSFPPFFQGLTAPMLQLFGFGGLYAIPALSLLLLWLFFGQTLYRLHLHAGVIAAALFCFCFCSPLTLYGAVYWEHTLAVLLLFPGLMFLMNPTDHRLLALLAGGFTGMAAWLRPEALLLWLLIVAMVLYNHTRQPKKGNPYFVAGSFVLIALFFICNKLLYGDFLGAHSYQLAGEASFPAQFTQSLILLLHLNAKQLLFFPLSALVYAMAVYAFVKKFPVPKKVVQLLLLSVSFSFIAPFFLPNAGGKQWGPRYFLFLIPVLLLAGALLIHHCSYYITRSWWLAMPVVLYSFYVNSISAYKTLHDDYAYRVNPCLQLLQQDSCNTIVVQNQFAAQEFAALFETKNIFLAENAFQYAQLQDLLLQAGKREWIFLAHDQELLLPCNPSELNGSVRRAGDYFFVRCAR